MESRPVGCFGTHGGGGDWRIAGIRDGGLRKVHIDRSGFLQLFNMN